MTADRGRTRFGPEPILLLPLSLALLGALPLAATTPWLSWLLLLPLVAAVWVVRAGVRVEAGGLEVCNGLRRRHVAWPAVEGFDIPRRGPVRLLHQGRRTVLLAVQRRDLARFVAAAGQVSSAAGGGAA